MRRSKVTERIILILALAGFLLILGSFFAFYSRKSQSQNRALLEFQASRAASNFLEYFTMSGAVAQDNRDENILGFGIYDSDGKALTRFGTAPETMAPVKNRPPGEPGGPSNDIVVHKDSIVITRPVGRPPGPGRGMGMTGFHKMLPDRPFPMPMRELSLFLEFSTKEFRRERKMLFASLGGFFIGFCILFGVIFSMYRKFRNYQLKSEENAHLLQLGAAARTLAHEIKNPLSALRLQVDILKKKTGERYGENLGILEQETARLSRLVDRVGEYLKNPKGNPERFHPLPVLAGIGKLYPFPVVVTGQIKPDTLLSFDRDRFRSLCDNLILNAWESMVPEALSAEDTPGNRIEGNGDKAVEVEITEERDTLRLAVKDRGMGVPKENREEIFTMFYTTKTKGSGIGLAIAKRFMEAAGGSIFVLPRDGGGSEFVCVFLKEKGYANSHS